MANKVECDRCGKLANVGVANAGMNPSTPDDWETIMVGSGIGHMKRDICDSCLSAFWEWFHAGRKPVG